MTYKVLTSDTKQILYRSRLCLASDAPNVCADAKAQRVEAECAGTDVLAVGEYDNIDGAMTIFDPSDTNPDNPNASNLIHRCNNQPMAIIDPEDLIGRTYLTIPAEDGTRLRLQIIEALNDIECNVNTSDALIHFKAVSSDGLYEEIKTNNQILDKLEDPDGTDKVWKFWSIDRHQGPLTQSNPNFKGSRWNVRNNWENGEVTYKPLSIIGKSDPVSCAIYANENKLLGHNWWKKFAHLAKRQKKLLCLVNQAKLRSYRTVLLFKFGIEVPKNHEHAMDLDRKMEMTYGVRQSWRT